MRTISIPDPSAPWSDNYISLDLEQNPIGEWVDPRDNSRAWDFTNDNGGWIPSRYVAPSAAPVVAEFATTRAAELPPGGRLVAGGVLASPDDAWRLYVNADGLAIHRTDTGSREWFMPLEGVAALVNQVDGNLVAYNAAWQPLWASGSAGRRPGVLRFSSAWHGDLALEDPVDGVWLWSSGTGDWKKSQWSEFGTDALQTFGTMAAMAVTAGTLGPLIGVGVEVAEGAGLGAAEAASVGGLEAIEAATGGAALWEVPSAAGLEALEAASGGAALWEVPSVGGLEALDAGIAAAADLPSVGGLEAIEAGITAAEIPSVGGLEAIEAGAAAAGGGGLSAGQVAQYLGAAAAAAGGVGKVVAALGGASSPTSSSTGNTGLMRPESFLEWLEHDGPARALNALLYAITGKATQGSPYVNAAPAGPPNALLPVNYFADGLYGATGSGTGQ